jgi:large conductance mechanosensitive channel
MSPKRRGDQAMLEEFKKFIMRGNVLDMAVGVIMGAAFGAVVESLVKDMIMPPIGAILGGVDFSSIFIQLTNRAQPQASVAAAAQAGVATLNIGVFINVVIRFLIISFAVFMLVKGVNNMLSRMKKEEAAAPPKAPPEDVVLLREIRDALKSR